MRTGVARTLHITFIISRLITEPHGIFTAINCFDPKMYWDTIPTQLQLWTTVLHHTYSRALYIPNLPSRILHKEPSPVFCVMYAQGFWCIRQGTVRNHWNSHNTGHKEPSPVFTRGTVPCVRFADNTVPFSTFSDDLGGCTFQPEMVNLDPGMGFHHAIPIS